MRRLLRRSQRATKIRMSAYERHAQDRIGSMLSAVAAGISTLEHDDHATIIDPFDFIDSGELTLSRLICWCLDPYAPHGEGEAFLRLFLETFGIDRKVAFETVRARCEVRTAENRSIDIVVECKDFILGIENKPYAAFGFDQLPHYHAHLLNTGKPFVLVALKGWVGSVPSDQIVAAVTDDSRFIDSDYRVLVTWLDACAKKSKSSGTKQFVMQMRDHMATHVIGEGEMETQDMLLSIVRDDAEKMHAALVIRDGSRTLEEELHRRLASAIGGLVPSEWTVSTKPRQRVGKMVGGHHYLTIDFGNRFPVVFIFEIAPRNNAAIFGVCRRRDAKLGKAVAKSIWEALDDTFFDGRGGNTDWLWWAHQYELVEHGRMDPSFDHIWHAMIEPGPLAEELVKLASDVRQLVVGALDRT